MVASAPISPRQLGRLNNSLELMQTNEIKFKQG